MVRISEVEKVRGRIRVVLDDGSEYLLLKSMLSERPLKVNDELDPEEFSSWVTQRQYRSALEKAVAFLAVRTCSKGEIDQKLRRIGYSPETVKMVLFKLDREGFLNDRDFADQWARYRSGQRYGPRRIAQELKMKGISGEDVESVLENLPEKEQLEDAVEIARKALKRAKSGEDPRKTREKMAAGIVRRGYSWDLARQACDQVLRDEEEWD